MANQNPWPPYNNYKDCSLGICTFYCPQFCYFNFPPPPQNDDSSTPFSPLIIAIIGILASAFLLVSYYTVVTRYCKRRNVQTEENEENLDVLSQRPFHAATAAGLDEASIKSITVFRYKKDEGLVEGSECSVCLSEFQENESLRLLPKCEHAFHLPCIDTWLKSHSNCPMCRASVVSSPYTLQNQVLTTVSVNAYEIQRPDDLILIVEEERSFTDTFNVHERNYESEEDLNIGTSNVNIRQSISLGTFSGQQRLMVSDTDTLKIDEDSDESRKVIGPSEELMAN